MIFWASFVSSSLWTSIVKIKKIRVVGRVLADKAYKRSIWLDTVMYETCLRFISKRFFESLIEAKPAEVILGKVSVSFKKIPL